MNQQDLKPSTWAKGFVGHQIARSVAKRILRADVLYEPESGRSEPFDFIGVEFATSRISAGDFKAKPARTFYPDTGINISQHERYKGFARKYKMPFPLLFIDEGFGLVYGNFWRILVEPRTVWWEKQNYRYPLQYHGIIYFPVEYMRILSELSMAQRILLRAVSTRNKSWKPNPDVRDRIGIALKPNSFEPKQFIFA